MLVSTAGSQMQIWALYWHIRTLSDQPAALSVIGLVRFVPILLFALYGGLIADRYDRRKVIMITQTVMMGTALALAYFNLGGGGPAVAHLCAHRRAGDRGFLRSAGPPGLDP